MRSNKHVSLHGRHLTEAAERSLVAALPGSGLGRHTLAELVSLAQASALATRGGGSFELALLVNGVTDPVDSGIVADGIVRRIDQQDLVVLVSTIGVDPIGAQHTQVGATGSNTFLGLAAERALPLQVVDTLLAGLAVHDTLGIGSLAVTTANANAVSNVALLGLETQAAGLVGARGAHAAVDSGELSVLPAANAQQE
jgi:hypothetical protein